MVFGEILSATLNVVDTYSFKGVLESRFLISARGVLSWLPLVEAGSGGAALPCSAFFLFSPLFTIVILFLFWCLLLSFVHPFPLLYSFSISLSSVSLRSLNTDKYLWPLYSEIKYFWISCAFIFLGNPVLNILMSNISKPVHYLLLAISLFPFIANVSIIWNIFTKMFFWLELLK